MKYLLSRHSLTAIAAGVVAAGGGAYALASSSGAAAITDCVNHKNGTLHKARQCQGLREPR
jgi:hypothetical protein